MQKLPLSLIVLGLLLSPLASADGEAGNTISRTPRIRPESPLTAGLDLQYVPIRYPNYAWLDGQTSERGGHGFHLGLEWLPLGDLYGKPGVGMGLGLYSIRDVDFAEQRASLMTIPIETFLSYRFDYFHNQLIVPFVKVGLSGTLARQEGITRPWRSYYGFDFAAGGQLCLNFFDRTTANVFDASMGVNTSYLTFEFLRSQPLGSGNAVNLSRDEYRLGLRVEM